MIELAHNPNLSYREGTFCMIYVETLAGLTVLEHYDVTVISFYQGYTKQI